MHNAEKLVHVVWKQQTDVYVRNLWGTTMHETVLPDATPRQLPTKTERSKASATADQAAG
jgi:hypothetical protein